MLICIISIVQLYINWIGESIEKRISDISIFYSLHPYSLTSSCLWILRDTNWRTEGKTRKKDFLFLPSHSLFDIWLSNAPISLPMVVFYFSCLFLNSAKHLLCSGNFWFSFILAERVHTIRHFILLQFTWYSTIPSWYPFNKPTTHINVLSFLCKHIVF